MSGPVLNVLFLGDVVGKGGRNAVRSLVPELKREFNCQFVIVNAENCANGSGMTAACLKDMPEVDVFTSGDHTWDQKTFEQEIRDIPNLVRPANFSRLQPGVGWRKFRNPAGGEIAVISLLGKVFMKESAYCPFETAEEIVKQLPLSCKCIIVDIHAEATSETAFLTDAGMVGANDSILGREVEAVVRKFRTGMPQRLPVCEKKIRLDGAVVSYELATGRAVAIKPISRMYQEENR